jgi:Domain of unknown function (DUF4387)
MCDQKNLDIPEEGDGSGTGFMSRIKSNRNPYTTIQHSLKWHNEATCQKVAVRSNTDPVASTCSAHLNRCCKSVRSKNAGLYELALDVMFEDPKLYETVKRSDVLRPAVVPHLYSIAEEDIIWCGFFDVAMAFKATIPRTRGGKAACSSRYMKSGVHGSQQYIPLM